MGTSSSSSRVRRGWLQKQNTKRKWQTRWVVLKGKSMSWADKRVAVQNETKQSSFSNCLHINDCATVEPGEDSSSESRTSTENSKTNRDMFEFVIRMESGTRKEYRWRSVMNGRNGEEDRDGWIKDLEEFMALTKWV